MSPAILRRLLYAWARLGRPYPHSTRLMLCPISRAAFRAGALRRIGGAR